MNLVLLEGRFAVCRLAADAAVPAWASGGAFSSVTRTADELSVACAEASVPEGAECVRGWRIFKVQGPLDFALTGILESVAAPLAGAGISIFAVATFETDYVMVSEANLEKAVEALVSAGHHVLPAPT